MKIDRKLIYSVIGYFLGTMPIAVLWHMVLFHDQYVEMGAFQRQEPILFMGMLAMLFQGVVFGYFYPLFYRHVGGGHPIVRGIQYSLFMGLTVWTVMVFATAAKFQIEPVWQFILLGTAFQVLQYISVGTILGLIHGQKV